MVGNDLERYNILPYKPDVGHPTTQFIFGIGEDSLRFFGIRDLTASVSSPCDFCRLNGVLFFNLRSASLVLFFRK